MMATEEELEEYSYVCSESQVLTVEHLVDILKGLDPKKTVHIYNETGELTPLTDISETNEKVFLYNFQ